MMPVIRTIHFILVSVFLFCCKAKKEKEETPDCSGLRTGRFESRSTFGKEILVERNDSIQIERNDETRMVIKLKIEWLGECEYKLTPLSLTANGVNRSVDFLPPFVKTEITKVTKNYYIVRSKFSNENTFTTDTLLILK